MSVEQLIILACIGIAFASAISALIVMHLEK
jgi:hypothetical protein